LCALDEPGDVLACRAHRSDPLDQFIDLNLDELDPQAPFEEGTIDIARHQPLGGFTD
jgi:hypothetical protein